MQTVRVIREFTAPVERTFAYLSEHENLGAIFPARVERLRDGDNDRNGVGSARRLSFNGLLPFVETVTAVEPNRRIEYRITKGTPLRDHRGEMLFAATPSGGSRLEYTIEFGSSVPGIAAVVAAALRRSTARGLDRLAAGPLGA